MRVIRTRSVVASVVAWTVGATIALAVSLSALSLVSTGLTSEPVQPVTRDIGAPANLPTLTPSLIPPDAAPANPTTASPTPSAPPSATPSATPKTAASDTTGNQRSLNAVGGTVVARCGAGGAYLVYWSPAPGYHVDVFVRGPAEPARLKFEGQGRELRVSVSCVTGTPQATTRRDGWS